MIFASLSNPPTAMPGIESKHHVDVSWSSILPIIKNVNRNNDNWAINIFNPNLYGVIQSIGTNHSSKYTNQFGSNP